MKKIITFSLFILCLFVVFSPQANAAQHHENDIIEPQASSVTVVSLDDQKVLFKITSDIDDVDALRKEAVKILKDNMLKNSINSDVSSDVSIEAYFCCVPNAPYREVRFDYHIALSNGYCVTYYQTAKQCLNCGEIYDYSSEKNIREHKTTASCP